MIGEMQIHRQVIGVSLMREIRVRYLQITYCVMDVDGGSHSLLLVSLYKGTLPSILYLYQKTILY